MCSSLHCSVLLDSDCAHRSDRPLGICEDHIQWLMLWWQWYQRTVVISGLRGLWALALCLRGSRGAGRDAHFTFSSAHSLLQRLHERFRVTRILTINLHSVNLELGKTQSFNYQSFLWPWTLNSTDKLSVCSYWVSKTNQCREKLNFSVCTETPVEILWSCFSPL